jgi:hypothetical protein
MPNSGIINRSLTAERSIPNTNSILATVDEEDIDNIDNIENPWTTVTYKKSRKERPHNSNSESTIAVTRKQNKTRRYLNERQRKINMGYTLNYNNSGILYKNYYDYLKYVILKKHIKKEIVGPEQLKQFQI